jgi:trehalose synthase
VVVQNSVKEGYGLTVGEAMYKRAVVVGTHQALGIRSQIVHEETGILVFGDPSVGANVARALWQALTQDSLRRAIAHNAQKSTVESGLSYTVRESN